MKIAVGITTTPDRHHIFWENLKKWQVTLPEDTYIFYSISHKKIAICENKNHILSMCHKADHIFMVDDDVYPVHSQWWYPYVNSGLNHACWNYDKKVIGACMDLDGSLETKRCWNILEKPNGCVLYFKKICIDTVGGWDTDFAGYGYEHVNVSDRIYNCGLTPDRYIDALWMDSPFALTDCESSFTARDRNQIPDNYKLYQEKFYSKEFKPFK